MGPCEELIIVPDDQKTQEDFLDTQETQKTIPDGRCGGDALVTKMLASAIKHRVSWTWRWNYVSVHTTYPL